jgi:hypothetical protein
MATKIQLRRDTAANWTSVNPVLAAGETGLEVDGSGTTTGTKVGDGVTAWVSLGYSFVMTSATVNSKSLTYPISLEASDVGAASLVDGKVPTSQLPIATASTPGAIPAGVATVVGGVLQNFVVDNSASDLSGPSTALLVRGALRAPGHPEGGHYETYIGGRGYPGFWTNCGGQFISWPATADGACPTLNIHGVETQPAIAIRTDTSDAQIICARGASNKGPFAYYDDNSPYIAPNERLIGSMDWNGRLLAAGGAQLADAILATTAVSGFLGIPICSGVPTGVPTSDSTTAQLVYDCAGGHLYLCWTGMSGVNIALTKAVTFSETPEWIYGTLTDGLINQNGTVLLPGVEFSTGFHNNTGSAKTVWAKVDLGSASLISKVRIHVGGGNYGVNAPDPVVISLSTDNITFTAAATITGSVAIGGLWIDIPFTATNARYVKVDMTATAGSYTGIGEIEVYPTIAWKLLA